VRRLIVNILLISDFHWLTVAVGQQKGQILQKWYEKIIERMIVDLWKKWNMWKKPVVLETLGLAGPFDEVIDVGDFIECEYNERGLLEEIDIKKYREYVAELKMHMGFLKKIYSAESGHLIGYRLPLHYDSEGGISRKSILNFQLFVGPLFETFRIGESRFIILSSSLFTQSFDHKFPEDQKYIENIKLKQNEFLVRTLAKVDSRETVFLFIHDPDSLEVIDRLLSEDAKKKINKVFCGHLHAKWVLKIYEFLGRASQGKMMRMLSKARIGRNIKNWASGNLERMKLFSKYKLQIVPAATGMMGLGGGFLILNLFDDGTYSVKEHKI